MSNLLQYTLSLQDRMSASLKAIGSNSDTALNKFGKLKKQAEDVKKTFTATGGSIGALRQKLDLLRSEREWIPSSNLKSIKAYNSEIDKLEKKISKLDGTAKRSGGKGGGLLKNFIGGTLIAGALAAGGAGLMAGTGNVINAGLDASKNKTAFEVLSGPQAGGKLYSDLTKFAQDSIFGSELYENAKTMRAFGIETEKIMPNLKMLGDVSMGDSNKLASLSLAYSQIMSTGRLMGQDLLQLINAGFNPLKIISDKTGISLGDLKDRMEKGQISAQMVEDAFKTATSAGGQFYQMTDKIAKTPFGKWEAFKGQMQGVAMQLGTALMPVFSKVLDVVSKLTDKLPDLISKFAPLFDVLTAFPFDKIINDIVGLIAPILVHAVPAFKEMIKYVGIIWDSLSPIFQALQPIIGTTAQVIMQLAVQVIALAAKIVTILSPAIASFINLLNGPLGKILLFVGSILEKIIDLVDWLITKFDYLSGKLNKVLGPMARILNTIIPATGLLTGAGSKPTPKSPEQTIFRYGSNDIVSGLVEGHMPGMTSGFANAFAGGKGGASAGTGSGRSKSNDAVATGGQKSTTININIDKQVETFTVMANNVKEGAEKVRDIIIDEMTRAIAMAQSLAY